MADDMGTHMQALTEWVEEYVEHLELSHYKCDIERDDNCYAEQYGDGTAEDHWRIRSIKELLDIRPAT